MEKIEITIQELRMATRPNVYRNRKKYSRKPKQKQMSDSFNKMLKAKNPEVNIDKMLIYLALMRILKKSRRFKALKT